MSDARDRILAELEAGRISAGEAIELIAALAEPEPSAATPSPTAPTDHSRQPPRLVDVQLLREDGTEYTVRVPPGFAPLLWQMVKVAMKESARSAAQDTWDGVRILLKRQGSQVGERWRSRRRGPETPAVSCEDAVDRLRATVLDLLAHERLAPQDAAALLEQIAILDDRAAAV